MPGFPKRPATFKPVAAPAKQKQPASPLRRLFMAAAGRKSR